MKAPQLEIAGTTPCGGNLAASISCLRNFSYTGVGGAALRRPQPSRPALPGARDGQWSLPLSRRQEHWPRTQEGLQRLSAAHTVRGFYGKEGRAFRHSIAALFAQGRWPRLLAELRNAEPPASPIAMETPPDSDQ